MFLDVIPTPQDIISDFSYICLLLTIKFEYMENISRRTAIKTFLAGGVALATTGIEAAGVSREYLRGFAFRTGQSGGADC